MLFLLLYLFSKVLGFTYKFPPEKKFWPRGNINIPIKKSDEERKKLPLIQFSQIPWKGVYWASPGTLFSCELAGAPRVGWALDLSAVTGKPCYSLRKKSVWHREGKTGSRSPRSHSTKPLLRKPGESHLLKGQGHGNPREGTPPLDVYPWRGETTFMPPLPEAQLV